MQAFFTRVNLAALFAEFLGTALLVSVALVMTQTTAVSYFVGTSLAITLVLIVLLFGGVSGAHVNPAITFGFWTARLISTFRAVGYIAAQLLGALAAWQLYQYLTENQLAVRAQAFSTPVWIAEVAGTFILALAVTAAVTRMLNTLHASVVYGAAYFVGIVVAATASAALINPAVAMGVRSFNMAYVLGPLVGGLLGVNLYAWLFAPERRTIRRIRK